MTNGGASKAGTQCARAESAPVAGLVPHFATFAPRDWEGPGDARIGRHTYAAARCGAEPPLGRREAGQGRGGGPAHIRLLRPPPPLPPIAHSPPSQQRRRPLTCALFAPTGSPRRARLSKVDVQVERIEMKESASAVPRDTALHGVSPRSPDDIVRSPGRRLVSRVLGRVSGGHGLCLNPFWYCVPRG